MHVSGRWLLTLKTNNLRILVIYYLFILFKSAIWVAKNLPLFNVVSDSFQKFPWLWLITNCQIYTPGRPDLSNSLKQIICLFWVLGNKNTFPFQISDRTTENFFVTAGRFNSLILWLPPLIWIIEITSETTSTSLAFGTGRWSRSWVSKGGSENE